MMILTTLVKFNDVQHSRRAATSRVVGWRIGQLTARSIDSITTSVVILLAAVLFLTLFSSLRHSYSREDFVPSSVMVPPRRLDQLLGQARQYQAQQCRYHVSNLDSSLYHDHYCSRRQFPTTTTHILEGHTDEVWQIQWSHSGTILASASRDKTVILWRIVSTP
jgi:WD40 repeat protein